MGEAENCSVIKRTLKSLCVSNGFSYGIFWGFHHKNPMLLTVEDSYHEERFRSAIDNLLLKVHMLGEGTVGQAAFSGKHQWILADERGSEWNSLRSTESKHTFQDDSEGRSQFSSGIKTIVVIPVEPRGVAQFGSTEKISERFGFVDQTVRLFQENENLDALNTLGNSHPVGKVETYDINALFASLISSQDSTNEIIRSSGDNCNELRSNNRSATSSNQPSPSTSGVHIGNPVFSNINSAYLDQYSCQFDKTSCISTWSREYPTALASFDQDLVPESRLQESTAFSSLYGAQSQTEPEKHFQGGPGDLMDSQQSLPSVFEELFEDFKPDDVATDLFNLCQADDFLQWFAPTPDQTLNQMVNALSGDLTQLVESTSKSSCLAGGDMKIEDPSNFVQENSVVIQSKDVSNALKHSVGCDQTGESWEDIMMPLVNGTYPTSSSASGKCASELNPTSISSARKGLFSELGLDELLAGTNSSSCLTGSNMEDQSWPAKRRRVESVGSSANISMSDYDMEKRNNIVMKKELPKSQVSLWIDDSYSLTAASAVPSSQPQKPEEQKRVIRKRARPGESTRPRPKDRQLIQDRIKELRGIIPNGGKCSIDSLLDRTIKYMVFLQGVTKHADKLKQSSKPKLIGNENGAVLRNKNNMSGGGGGGGGATWAFEVGGQSMVCPIIVEDLSPPGQMLIEMLCEEQGFFLEITDIIRGFGLSILKGVMELREGKIWAHFIVEAKSHVTRIDVFWSLVRLLQTSGNLIDPTNQPSNVVLDGGVPLMDGYQKPNLLPPICLAEALH